MKDNTLKAYVVIALFIVIGIIIILINKFQFNVNYSKNVRLDINLGKSFDISDVTKITSDVYDGKTAIVRKAGDYGDIISITLKEYTDEQNEKLISKINETYQTELATDDISIYNNSNVRERDIIRPFLLPVAISGAIILIAFAIRYRKLGICKVVGNTVLVIICIQVLYLALISIFGMQINEATIAMGLTITIFCLMYNVATNEKSLSSK